MLSSKGATPAPQKSYREACSPTTVSDALTTHSPLFVTPALAAWADTVQHTAYNGLLVRRPFHGQWDTCQVAIDACLERDNLGLHGDPDSIALTRVKLTENLAVELVDAVGNLLRTAALPPLLSQQIFKDACDIGRVVASMCSSAYALEIKLEIAGANTCKRWHQDHFVGRALVSYTGVVGTEYTRDENVNFWELNNCGNADHILRTADDIAAISVGDILFIKGKKYDREHALVHRSPPPRFHPDGRVLNRLLLKVDVLSNPGE